MVDLVNLRAVAKAKMDQPRIDCPDYQNDAAFQMSLFAGDVIELLDRADFLASNVRFDELKKERDELAEMNSNGCDLLAKEIERGNTLKAENEQLNAALDTSVEILACENCETPQSRLGVAESVAERLQGEFAQAQEKLSVAYRLQGVAKELIEDGTRYLSPFGERCKKFLKATLASKDGEGER